jgi:transcriptional regulator with XRE-family HTH domain
VQADRTHRPFGQALRSLRKARGYTLRQVAEATADLAARPRSGLEESGRVSDTYLAQLETGRAFNVTLPKLLTLAAVYGVRPEDLIEKAPNPLRAERLSELERWRAASRAILAPLKRLPATERLIQQKFDEAVRCRARHVNIPLDDEPRARRQIRRLLTYASLPAFLQHSPETASAYWTQRRDALAPVLVKAEDAFEAEWDSSKWAEIVAGFCDWATYDSEVLSQACQSISWWSFDFSRATTTCHFWQADSDQAFGFDDVVLDVVEGVRKRQLARLLAGAPGVAGLPAPPNPLQAARDYIAYLVLSAGIHGDLIRTVGETPRRPAADALLAIASTLRDEVPDLRAPIQAADHAQLRAVADILNKAARQKRRRPSRSVPAKRRR